MNIFIELSLIIAIVLVVSCIMKLLRQPLVAGYIFTGILVGPHVLGILHSTEYIELFSKIGIATLLFILGLELNPMVIKEMGKPAVVGGIGQFIVVGAIGYGAAHYFGFDIVSSLIIGAALTFSSTIIILKLLLDKKDISKLYGKISVGMLLIEDILATLVLLVVSALSSAGGESITNLLLMLCIKGAIAIAALLLISKYILPYVSKFFATSQELLFLFSMAWGLGMAALFYTIGFSIEIGALIAGVTLSLSPFAYEMGSRIKPLRDFFIILFFILLGSHMAFDNISALIYPALVFALIMMVIKPVVIFILMNLLGYKRRTSYLTGFTFGQMSEFSIIIAALAASVGYISTDVLSVITLAGIISIVGSTYVILYAESMYKYIGGLFRIFELRNNKGREKAMKGDHHDAIIFGFDRVGADFVQAVEKLGSSYLVVDFNPSSIRKLEQKHIPHRYGDADDVEFLNELEFEHAKLVISTIPDPKTSMLLVKTYRKVNPTGIIMVLSHTVENARELYLAGASYVVMPHFLGAHYASLMIARHGFNNDEFERERNIHLQKLAKREEA